MTTESPTFQAPAKPKGKHKPAAPKNRPASAQSSKVQTAKFIRKSFPVDAVQVTPENMEQIAAWCAGTIMHDGDKEGHLSRDYIKVRVAFPINDRQTQAYLGDWVLKSGKSFKVYTNSAFEKSFAKADVG